MAEKPTLNRWAIYLIRSREELLGSVEAPDEPSAIEAAINKYRIMDTERQKQLVARHARRVLRHPTRTEAPFYCARACRRSPSIGKKPPARSETTRRRWQAVRIQAQSSRSR